MSEGEAAAWEYVREDGEGLRAAAILAMDRLADPDLNLEIVANRGDHLTVRVLRGTLESPEDILYLERRGTFEILRVECWPRGATLDTVLVLRAWPAR